ENQKLFLMLDAASAHTDCLIQIVKEQSDFHRCGSGILLNRLLKSSLNFQGFLRLSTKLFALPLAVSMEAHYREIDHIGKGVFALNSSFCIVRSPINQSAHFLTIKAVSADSIKLPAMVAQFVLPSSISMMITLTPSGNIAPL
ncbi:hypothetical protein, partial [Aeromonas enteropelogenes]|uniref:hypothetical protein n=1 Tax=Aeromonas enteropelogenes TaxID=29489 RepID=UPI003B9EBCA8